MNLPQAFKARMKNMLGGEYDEYIKLCDMPFKRGLRVNTLKADIDLIKSKINCIGERTPFCSDNYYIEDDAYRLGNHPFHHAGAFYLQEPSASSAVTVLDVQPGDRVLDLCAAPGGKSTQIGARLNGKGLLWSNEVIKNRAVVLSSNIERCGIRNAVVSSMSADALCSRLEGYFDRILVDAPCSGEGMFGKSSDALSQWSEEYVAFCAERQLQILNCAKRALKAGGIIVYSTCTFSYEENEGVIEKFLKQNPEFQLIDSGVSFGRSALGMARRIFPMDGGEGHFAAKLKKLDGDIQYTPKMYDDSQNTKMLKKACDMFGELFSIQPYGEISFNNGVFSILPDDLPDIRGLSIIRAGVPFCVVKKDRMEPHHSVYLASLKEENNRLIDLDCDDERMTRFLHGEEIQCSNAESGFTAVAVNGIVTGFGKCSGGVLKNRYPKGLRLM